MLILIEFIFLCCVSCFRRLYLINSSFQCIFIILFALIAGNLIMLSFALRRSLIVNIKLLCKQARGRCQSFTFFPRLLGIFIRVFLILISEPALDNLSICMAYLHHRCLVFKMRATLPFKLPHCKQVLRPMSNFYWKKISE